MAYLIGFGIGVVIYALALWIGFKVLGLKPNFGGALLIAVVCSGLGMIPSVGGILSLVGFGFMVVYFMHIDLVPTGLALAVVAGVLNWGATIAIVILLSNYQSSRSDHDAGNDINILGTALSISAISVAIEGDFEEGYDAPAENEFQAYLEDLVDRKALEVDETRDAWGADFNYSLSAPNDEISQETIDGNAFYIWSNGPDGENDDGLDDDVFLW